MLIDKIISTPRIGIKGANLTSGLRRVTLSASGVNLLPGMGAIWRLLGEEGGRFTDEFLKRLLNRAPTLPQIDGELQRIFNSVRQREEYKSDRKLAEELLKIWEVHSRNTYSLELNLLTVTEYNPGHFGKNLELFKGLLERGIVKIKFRISKYEKDSRINLYDVLGAISGKNSAGEKVLIYKKENEAFIHYLNFMQSSFSLRTDKILDRLKNLGPYDSAQFISKLFRCLRESLHLSAAEHGTALAEIKIGESLEIAKKTLPPDLLVQELIEFSRSVLYIGDQNNKFLKNLPNQTKFENYIFEILGILRRLAQTQVPPVKNLAAQALQIVIQEIKDLPGWKKTHALIPDSYLDFEDLDSSAGTIRAAEGEEFRPKLKIAAASTEEIVESLYLISQKVFEMGSRFSDYRLIKIDSKDGIYTMCSHCLDILITVLEGRDLIEALLKEDMIEIEFWNSKYEEPSQVTREDILGVISGKGPANHRVYVCRDSKEAYLSRLELFAPAERLKQIQGRLREPETGDNHEFSLKLLERLITLYSVENRKSSGFLTENFQNTFSLIQSLAGKMGNEQLSEFLIEFTESFIMFFLGGNQQAEDSEKFVSTLLDFIDFSQKTYRVFSRESLSSLFVRLFTGALGRPDSAAAARLVHKYHRILIRSLADYIKGAGGADKIYEETGALLKIGKILADQGADFFPCLKSTIEAVFEFGDSNLTNLLDKGGFLVSLQDIWTALREQPDRRLEQGFREKMCQFIDRIDKNMKVPANLMFIRKKLYEFFPSEILPPREMIRAGKNTILVHRN